MYEHTWNGASFSNSNEVKSIRVAAKSSSFQICLPLRFRIVASFLNRGNIDKIKFILDSIFSRGAAVSQS